MRLMLLVLALAGLASAATRAEDDPRRQEPKGWDVRLAPPGESGERFELSGHVLGPGGRAMAGVRLFAYHADSKGEYGAHYPRLAAMLLTGPHGEYRLRTVLPGSYEGYPGHVHFELHDGSTEPSFVNVFKQGARVTTRPSTVARRGRDGVWRATWDVGQGTFWGDGGPQNTRARARLDPAIRSDSAWYPPRRPAAHVESLFRAPPDSSRKR